MEGVSKRVIMKQVNLSDLNKRKHQLLNKKLKLILAGIQGHIVADKQLKLKKY